MKHGPFRINAVLFDFDGTLTKPGALDFSAIRKALGCPQGRPILEFIETLPDPGRREKTLAELERLEIEAAAASEPNTGAEALVQYLRSKGLRIGIISRNSLASIHRALENFEKIGISDFDVILSRDEPVKPKPSGDGILLAARKLGVDVKQMLVVGDFIFDIQAGHSAGALTIFLDNRSEVAAPPESDYTVGSLEDIKKIIRLGLPLPAGKLPNDLLGTFLEQLGVNDPFMLIRPGVGEDTAAMDVKGEEVLVLKSDPITFATDAIGHYAVVINANDIATSGAEPRWFLTSLLFPCGTTASEIRQVMDEMETVCRQLGITLCGGHTEITDAVSRPVVTGMLAGTVRKSDLIDKRGMKPGDKILLTKAIAAEGTAIIAREFGGRLSALGMPEADIETCRQFLSFISVLKEAKIARDAGGVSAMHDVTEGGLSTALEEFSISGRHKIRIDMDSIPVFPQTERICRLLGINPLGLIGSGSLLICCRDDSAHGLMSLIRDAGIDATCIGEVLEKGQGVEAGRRDVAVKWPRFEVDEITRLFQEGGS